MLETLNPRKVNIKNLTTIPDREDELPWDFEKAINDKEWRLLITALESQKEDKNWSSFAELASDMQLLFPAGASSLGLDINAFAGILGTINEHEKMGHWEHVAKYSARLVLLYPNNTRDYFPAERWDNFKIVYGHYRQNDPQMSQLSLAENLTVLYPDKKDELAIGAVKWNQLSSRLFANFIGPVGGSINTK